MTWKQTLISPLTSIREAVEALNRSALQICLVTNEDGKLIGTLTDGDIRRAILDGIAMNSVVSDVMNDTPVAVPIDTDESKMRGLMRDRRLHQLPILDPEGRVVGLVEMASLIQEVKLNENWVVLMAGGKGTRLRPLTDGKPKPLLEVGNKPLLETILKNFVQQKFQQFYISVNYKSEMIKTYFGNGSKWGIEIRYLEEKSSLGTAGGLRLIEERPKEPLIVMNGDLLTQVNFNQLLSFHEQHQSQATMCVREYEMQVPFGVVSVKDNQISKVDEKPTHRFFVNAGIYVLDPSLIEIIPQDGPFDMPMLFDRIIGAGLNTSVFPIHEYWMDVGQLDDYRRANREFDEHFEK